jgi:DNA processing protein
LIKQGAKLVEHVQDIVAELAHLSDPPAVLTGRPLPPASQQLPELSAAEAEVLGILEPYPLHIDDLVRRLSMEPGRMAAILLKLELTGLVQQLPGKYFSKEERS